MIMWRSFKFVFHVASHHRNFDIFLLVSLNFVTGFFLSFLNIIYSFDLISIFFNYESTSWLFVLILNTQTLKMTKKFNYYMKIVIIFVCREKEMNMLKIMESIFWVSFESTFHMMYCVFTADIRSGLRLLFYLDISKLFIKSILVV